MSAASRAVEHFRARVVQDALAEASADYWLRRATTLEAARPRQGDFHGQATHEALQARWDRLSETAAACRAAAEVALIRDDDQPDVRYADRAVHHDGDEDLVDRPHDGDRDPNTIAISAGSRPIWSSLERAWVVAPHRLADIMALAEHQGRRVEWRGRRAG